MTIIAAHLQHLAADLVKAASVIEALEKERDEYRRRLEVATAVIERCSLRLTLAEESTLLEYRRSA